MAAARASSDLRVVSAFIALTPFVPRKAPADPDGPSATVWEQVKFDRVQNRKTDGPGDAKIGMDRNASDQAPPSISCPEPRPCLQIPSLCALHRHVGPARSPGP